MIKQTFYWLLSMTLFISTVHSSERLHRLLTEKEKENCIFVWEEFTEYPFDELIISWNAERPTQGAYLIQVSVLTEEWSPWFDYAFWGTHDQYL